MMCRLFLCKLRQCPCACTSRRGLRIPRFRKGDDYPVDQPCVVQGLAAGWPAMREWQIDSLMSEKYNSCLFQSGVDSETGAPALTTVAEYWRNGETNVQIFDPAFEVDCPQMLEHYSPPTRCQGRNDLLHVLGNERPDFRWFLFGLRGSGTPLHIDPLCSSAWNTLVVGRKRWIVFAEHHAVSASYDAGSAAGAFGSFVDRDSWEWCESIRTAASEEADGVFEFDQDAGETVVVPARCRHAVANMEDSVAITHNFVTAENVLEALQLLREESPEMARRWVCALMDSYPDIARNLQHDC